MRRAKEAGASHVALSCVRRARRVRRRASPCGVTSARVSPGCAASVRRCMSSRRGSPRRCGCTARRRAGCAPSARGRPTSDFPAARRCGLDREQRVDHVVGVGGLRQIIDRAELHGVDRGRDVAVAGEHDAVRLGPALLQRRDDVEPVAVAEPHVDHRVERRRLLDLQQPVGHGLGGATVKPAFPWRARAREERLVASTISSVRSPGIGAGAAVSALAWSSNPFLISSH